MVANPFDETALGPVRRAYARQLMFEADAASDERLGQAFAEVPREAFLGPGPWSILRGPRFEPKPAPADPALIYQDVLIALKPEKKINNGSPSLHARWLHAAAVKPGERIAHIGAGTGYYTAILAKLVAPQGEVIAVEFDADLADRARKNLAPYGNVRVNQGDGALWPRELCDVVYVNFAVDRPAPNWIERLNPGGRLIFPLGTIAREPPARSYGVGLRVERLGSQTIFAAQSLGDAFFVRASGGSGLLATGEEREALLSAFESAGPDPIRSLRWKVPPSPDRACYAGLGWSLGYDEP